MPSVPPIQETPTREPFAPYLTYNLMTWNNVIAERLQLAFDDVQIGSAHSTSPDAQQYLAGSRRGNRDIADFERAGSDACGTL